MRFSKRWYLYRMVRDESWLDQSLLHNNLKDLPGSYWKWARITLMQQNQVLRRLTQYKRRSNLTWFKTCPTEGQLSSECFSPRALAAASFAPAKSSPKRRRLIPVASWTRDCILALLQGLSRDICVPCIEFLVIITLPQSKTNYNATELQWAHYQNKVTTW